MALHYPNTNVPFPSVHKGKDQERGVIRFIQFEKLQFYWYSQFSKAQTLPRGRAVCVEREKPKGKEWMGKVLFKKSASPWQLISHARLKFLSLWIPEGYQGPTPFKLSASPFFCCAQFDEQHRNAFCDAVSGGFFFLFPSTHRGLPVVPIANLGFPFCCNE